MRQILALAIAIQSYRFIRENKVVKPFLIILLAFFIHKTALMLLVLIPLAKIKNYKKALKWVFIGDIIVIMSIPLLRWGVSTLIPRYASYFAINYWDSTLGFGSTLMLIIEAIICAYVLWLQTVKKKNVGEGMFIATSCTSLSIAFAIMSLQVVMFERIAMMFRIFLPCLFPKAANFFTKESKRYYLIFFVLLLACEFLSYAAKDARQYSFFWS